ncbi:MAG: glycosyltransferase family 2 protein [Acidobacteriota bacterium]
MDASARPASLPQPRADVIGVIPAYRCADTVGAVVAGVRRFLTTVIVVDDGSDDGTAAAARAAGARVIVRARNGGKGRALREGVAAALADAPDAVVLLDADGQHDPADLPGFLDAWDGGAGELLIGRRFLEGAAEVPTARYRANTIGSRIISALSGAPAVDSQCGYRLLAARLLARMPLRARGYAIESEILLRATFRRAPIASVPIATIYDGNVSHFRPILDTTRIVLACFYYGLGDLLVDRPLGRGCRPADAPARRGEPRLAPTIVDRGR